MKNLHSFISYLRSINELVDIHAPVDACLEIAEIHRRVIDNQGPALLFHNVKNSKFPVVTNLFGSKKRVDIAFASFSIKEMDSLIDFVKSRDFSISNLWRNKRNIFKLIPKPTGYSRSSVTDNVLSPLDLHDLPFLKSWPNDGGSFITLPLVYTESPQTKISNLGMYRMQRFDSHTMGLHFQIHKGGGFHLDEAESLGIDLPVTVFLGGPPFLILSAIAPLPENISELMLCKILMGKNLKRTNVKDHAHSLINECEFAILGHTKCLERKPEGPFGDHYGYYSLKHDFPVFHCKQIYHKKNAIYPATIVGKPRQEDFFIGEYIQNIFSPIISMLIPSIISLKSYGEAGFHSLTSVIVKERYYRECISTAFRILGEGQLSLTKFLIVTDQHIDLSDIKSVLTTVLERFNPATDLFIFPNLSMDTLDYTGPSLNKGSKGIMLGIGEKIKDLPDIYNIHQHGNPPSYIIDLAVFCPGCLLIEINQDISIQEILGSINITQWPLIIIVDNAKALVKDTLFIWTVFTRFDPASDIHAQYDGIKYHKPMYKTPILIDARMKDSYPPEVICDDHTHQLVSDRWTEYGIRTQ